MRYIVITLVLLIALRDAPLFFGQAEPPPNRTPDGDPSLRMTLIGEGELFGHGAAFRTYETSDHTKASVWYGEFRSEEEAKNGIKLLLKEHKITHEELVKDLNGRRIDNRIVASSNQKTKCSWSSEDMV